MIEAYKNKLQQLKGQKSQILSYIKETEQEIKREKRNLRNTEDAQIIIQTVAKQTQQELEYHISEIVSLALSSVFDTPYELKLEFVLKRGKTEAELWFIRDGEKMNPLMASGGGVVDVASFALRIALWSLKNPKSRNTIILDEPFKMLSRELQPKASLMLKMLSEKLKLQFIVVTHNQDLIESANKIFETKIKKGVTQINEA